MTEGLGKYILIRETIFFYFGKSLIFGFKSYDLNQRLTVIDFNGMSSCPGLFYA